MHARVVTVQLEPEKVDEAVAFFQELKAALEQPGFNSTRFLSDRATGNALIVTVWDTEADLEASEGNGFMQSQMGNITTFFAGGPSIARYEIAFQMQP